MRKSFTPPPSLFSFRNKVFCSSLALLIFASILPANAQSGCNPISTLPCENLQVQLPFNLNFDNNVDGTITDKNGAGIGFTMVASYSGSRLSQDGTSSNPNVPGYDASKLTITGGRLQIVSNKGIAHLTNNNQINTLGVQVNSQGKLQLETSIINPFNGGSSQQAGLWFGLNDKTFIKLNISANKIELRKETNDISSNVAGTSNPDQRITGTIANLNTTTVRLRLIIDPAGNTVEGFYSTSGTSFVNVGGTYPIKTLSISGMGLTLNTPYAGIFSTHRNSTTSVTYNFDDFSIQSLEISSNNNAPVFSPSSYNFSLPDNTALTTSVGNVNATDADSDPIAYSIVSGNTNGAFVIDASTGALTVAKTLNYNTQNSYSLIIRATDPAGFTDNATVNISLTIGAPVPDFNTITWGSGANQPIGTHEVHGEVVKGKLYIFGGYDVQKQPTFTPTKRCYVYNPDNNTWSTIAELPHTPKGTNFGGVTHEGLTTDGTDIYFAGGYTSNANGTGQLFGTTQVWKYNVALNTYTALPNLPQPLAAGQLQYLKGKLHYMGGANISRKDVGLHFALDLDNLAAGWQPLAPLSDPRNHPGSAVYDGKIYFIGGAHGQDHATATQKTVEAYDADSNAWTRVADMPVALDHISSAVTVFGNRIFILGGETSHNVKTAAVMAYTPSTNTWSNLTPLPGSRSAGIAVALKGAIYYTGGNFSTTNRKGTPGTSTGRQTANWAHLNLDSLQSNDILKIYPNPVTGQKIQIDILLQHHQGNIILRVKDRNGHVHEEQHLTTDETGAANTTLALSKRLLPGLYFLQVQTGTGVIERKLVME